MSDIVPKNLQFLSLGDYEMRKLESRIGSLKISFWAVISKRKILIFAKEFVTGLGFTNTNKAIADHVDSEDVTTVENVFGKDFKMTLKQHFQTGNKSLPVEFFHKLRANQKLFKKQAIYALCLGSRLPDIKPFRRWVYGIIDEVMETGSYTLSNDMQQLSIEETPVEKVKSTFKDIPDFEFGGDNIERKELRKAFKEGGALSVDLEQSERSTIGGLKTQSRIRTLKIFVRDFYLESENLDEEKEDDVKLQFFKDKLEELKEIIMEQKLLTKKFESKK